jgi:hypothetical protein
MTSLHTYITTTIPYVNARPHIGFALELVQADVLARFVRQRGELVRFQAGTDDNSLPVFRRLSSPAVVVSGSAPTPVAGRGSVGRAKFADELAPLMDQVGLSGDAQALADHRSRVGRILRRPGVPGERSE